MKSFSELISLAELIYDDIEHGKTVQAAERLQELQGTAYDEGVSHGSEKGMP